MNYKSSFEEVWEARRNIFDMCHRSPKELVEYYINLQNKNKGNGEVLNNKSIDNPIISTINV